MASPLSVWAVAFDDVAAGLQVEHCQVVALAYRVAGDAVVNGDRDLEDLPGHIEAVGVQDPTGKAATQILISVDGHLRAPEFLLGVAGRGDTKRVRP